MQYSQTDHVHFIIVLLDTIKPGENENLGCGLFTHPNGGTHRLKIKLNEMSTIYFFLMEIPIEIILSYLALKIFRKFLIILIS